MSNAVCLRSKVCYFEQSVILWSLEEVQIPAAKQVKIQHGDVPSTPACSGETTAFRLGNRAAIVHATKPGKHRGGDGRKVTVSNAQHSPSNKNRRGPVIFLGVLGSYMAMILRMSGSNPMSSMRSACRREPCSGAASGFKHQSAPEKQHPPMATTHSNHP